MNKMLRLLASLTALAAMSSLGMCRPATNAQQSDSGFTDMQMIVSTAQIVNQKSGSDARDPPGLPAPNPHMTAVDGNILSVNNPESSIPGAAPSSSDNGAHRRYTEVFSGHGTAKDDRDAAVIGTAYLTYTVIPNSTYGVDDCLKFCDSVPGCVFVNLYYEYNNILLDQVFPEHSNLKCAAFGDVHGALDKTNFGGQPFKSQANLTYIQHSSGYALASYGSEPPVPVRYTRRFGPSNAANIAAGYMGFAFLDRYDVNACAQLCNLREHDPVGGRCRDFNIWRAEVNGTTSTYTCSMYYVETDESTATNTGQDNLAVRDSRGYVLSE